MVFKLKILNPKHISTNWRVFGSRLGASKSVSCAFKVQDSLCSSAVDVWNNESGFNALILLFSFTKTHTMHSCLNLFDLLSYLNMLG